MIKTRILIALVVAGIAGVVAVPATAAPIRECGNIRELNGHEVTGSPAGILNLTTRNVRCGYARRFSVKTTEHWGGYIHGRRSFQSFKCLAGPLGMYKINVRCVRGPDVIHWQLGD
jgi:hypothetical protein